MREKAREKEQDFISKMEASISAFHQVSFRSCKSTHSASAATLGRLSGLCVIVNESDNRESEGKKMDDAASASE